MKLVRFLGLAVILTGMSFAAFADGADSGAVKTGIQKVVVKKHLSNVYVRFDDPKSDIIKQVKKGEELEMLLVTEGGSWYQVKVDGKVGYIEARNVVNKSGGKLVMILLFIIVFAACAAGVVYYVKKQQIVPSASDDDDDLDDDDLR